MSEDVARTSAATNPPVIHLPEGVPTDYDNFVSMYYDKIRNQVRNFAGIDTDDVDDITQIIIMQFVKDDYLSIYDHGKQAAIAQERYNDQMAQYEAGELHFKPQPIHGKFTSYLYQFVYVRLLGLRDRSNRLNNKEGISLNELVEFQDADSEDHRRMPSSFIGLTGVCDKEFISIELRQILRRCFQLLTEYTVPTNTRNLPELFNQMVEDTFTTEENKFNKEAYAARKGVTISAVSMQQRDMKSFLTAWGLDKDLKFLFIQRMRHPEEHVAV